MTARRSSGAAGGRCARKATDAEAADLWPRLAEAYLGFEHYRSVATRELPVVILEPR